MRDVTPAMVRAWYAECCPEHERTQSAAYALLKAILNTAVEDDLLKSNPCKIRGASTSRRQGETTLPTVEQLATITGEMPERYAAVIPLAAWCGLRAGEIAALTRADLDLESGLLRVRQSTQNLPGGRVLGDTKTRESRRTITIPESITPILQHHLDQWVGPGDDALLFHAARDSERPIPAETLRLHWTKARDTAGLARLRLHDLRHFQGTVAAQSGATLAEVMARLGHTSAETAMRYQHAAAERDTELAGKLSDIATVTPIRRAAP